MAREALAGEGGASDDVEELVSALARQHHAPRGVDQFGVEAVPPALRTAGWSEIFLIFFTGVLNPGFLVLPGILVVTGGLSFWETVIALPVGGLIMFLAAMVVTNFGTDHGLPGLMFVRAVFGIRVARYGIAVLRTLVGCYWFGFQTLAASMGIVGILKVITGREFDYLQIGLILGIVFGCIALYGYKMMQRVGRRIWPLLVGYVILIFYLYLDSHNPAYAPSNVLAQPPRVPGWSAFALWFSINAGTFAPWFVSGSDLSRYGRSRRQVYIGFALGAPCAVLITAMAGAYGAVASGEMNVFAVAARLTDNPFLLIALLCGLVLSVAIANAMNLYTGGLAFVNTLPMLGRFWSTVIMAMVAVALSQLPTLIQDAQNWFSDLARVFTPLGGVILVDYVLCKRGRVDVAALSRSGGRYRYWHEINVLGLAAVVLGYVLYGILPDWSLPSLTTLAATGATYAMAVPIAKRLVPAYREAATPA